VAPPPRLSSTGAEREPSTTRSILRDMRHVACGRPQLAAAWPPGGWVERRILSLIYLFSNKEDTVSKKARL
jgi:hypothetical protein